MYCIRHHSVFHMEAVIIANRSGIKYPKYVFISLPSLAVQELGSGKCTIFEIAPDANCSVS